MKSAFISILIIMFSMLVIPLLSLPKNPTTTLQTATTTDNIIYEKKEPKTSYESFKVLKDDNILELSTKDYVFGVVAAEMPALYETEALKAQAVAAYTFACYRKQNNSNADYDITADSQTAQCFITREEAVSRWGEKANEYTKKIDDCISAVQNEILIYEDKPIFAAYHAISSGVTNSCNDVWGKDIPYLQPVASDSDKLSEGYLSEVSFSADEIVEKLKNVASASGEIQNYFSDFNILENGYVKDLKFCETKINGSELTKLLGLRSSNFTIETIENGFLFTVKGYGHGVGMSQTGADYMAKQGYTYKEILLHYYRGATLEKNLK